MNDQPLKVDIVITDLHDPDQLILSGFHMDSDQVKPFLNECERIAIQSYGAITLKQALDMEEEAENISAAIENIHTYSNDLIDEIEEIFKENHR